MKKYYLFGAGNNAWGVISYFGRENIIAIIDNESKKIGIKLEGVPVVSFEQYMLSHGDETIIITTAIFDEIVNQLEDAGISNYYIAPLIQLGLVDAKQVIKDFQLERKEKLVIWGYNPIAEKFIDELRGKITNIELKILSKDGEAPKFDTEAFTEVINYNQLLIDDTVLLFAEETKSDIQSYIKNRNNTIDIFTLETESNKKFGKKLIKFKNLHKGESCFIVGNGPSLQISDLEQIQKRGICSFGMNLSYHIYDKTFWRPSYHVICEYNILREYYDDIKRLRHDNLFIKNFYYMDETPYLDDINYYPGYSMRNYYKDNKFSDDITKVVYAGYSVTYDALQIAIYMGFKKIYLIGNDFSYMGDPAGKGNHFYDDIMRDKRIVAGRPYINVTLKSLQIAKEYADSNGIIILNATRGGKLEVFQRADIDKVFEEDL